MDHQGGKRVIKGDRKPRGAKAALIVILVLAAALIAGYVGLCAYVDRAGTFLPNTAIAGVDVGGMTQAEASSARAASATNSRVWSFSSSSRRSISARLMLSPGTGASSISMAEVICRISVLFWLMTELIAARIDLWSGSSSSVGELWQYLVP